MTVIPIPILRSSHLWLVGAAERNICNWLRNLAKALYHHPKSLESFRLCRLFMRRISREVIYWSLDLIGPGAHRYHLGGRHPDLSRF